MKRCFLLLLGTFLVLPAILNSQIASTKTTIYDLFVSRNKIISPRSNEVEIPGAHFLQLQSITLEKLIARREKSIRINLGFKNITLDLYQNDLFDGVPVRLSSGKRLDLSKNLYYWGTVNGEPENWVALSIDESGIAAVFTVDGEMYNLAKASQEYVVFKGDATTRSEPFSCGAIPGPNGLEFRESSATQANSANCVRVYVEVDHDIVTGKGSVQAAADYVANVFNQVSILYSRDNINLSVSEMLVWDVLDPYTATSVASLHDQFTNRLGGVFNGNIAHLVGYAGNGGRAYINTLCNKTFATGYSDINSTYNSVPVYSWTINVITHEIGHNLGSPHTHDCAWNGNNTAIDGCGFQAGYGGCSAPIPAKGTIMSYCHLLSGVGIDFNLGFGPQPGDLIRSRVYNATCLTTCTAPNTLDAGISQIITPRDLVCAPSVGPEVRLTNFGTASLTSVQIVSRSDAGSPVNFLWSGNLAPGASVNVTLAAIAIVDGSHTFQAYTVAPNNSTDANPSNDASSTAYNNLTCNCSPANQNFPVSNLTHTGTGSAATSLALRSGSANVSFTISGLEARLGGTPSLRYNESAIVTYRDGNNILRTFGTFSGSSQANATISINGLVNSVTVSLTDGYDGNSPVTLQISLSAVNYCASTEPCVDDDQDGVCNEVDLCPGYDDRLDADNDGIPDGCDTPDCLSAIASFSSTTLTHTGPGTAAATATLPSGSKEINFTINGLSARLSGNQSRRYNEQVQVYYTNAQGEEQLFNSYSGSVYSDINIQISAQVQAIRVVLSDGYNGGINNQPLSVQLSQISYCTAAGNVPTSGSTTEGFIIYPNPSKDLVWMDFGTEVKSGQIIILDILGREVYRQEVKQTTRLEMPIKQQTGASGMFLVILQQNHRIIQTEKLLIQ